MATNKSKKSKLPKKKIKDTVLHPKWDELKEVGFLTIADIQTPHMIVEEVMTTYADDIEKDPELKEICVGLDKSYYDCIDKCLHLMSQHVDGPFPKNHQEVLTNPDSIVNAKFKEGEVGFGIDDKDVLYNENMLYQTLHSQYQLLGHEIHTLTHKGKVAMEMKLSAKHNAGKSKEEIEEATKKLLEENKKLEDNLNVAKELIEIASNERVKMVEAQHKLNS